MLSHFAGDVAEDFAGGPALVEAQLEHRVGQGGRDGGFYFNGLGFGQGWRLLVGGMVAVRCGGDKAIA